jgi:hypothetical protein
VLANRVRRLATEPASSAADVPPRASAPEREATFSFGAVETSCGVREGVIVRDVNIRGARIDFTRALTLPRRVLLVAPGMGLRRWAEVVWRDGRSVGLKFEARPVTGRALVRVG